MGSSGIAWCPRAGRNRLHRRIQPVLRIRQSTEYKWLDLERLAQRLLLKESIVTIKYFTARVSDRLEDPHQSQRQDVYLRALRSNPRIEIFEGHFKTRKKPVPLAKANPDGSRDTVMAMVTEEKGSDVALGAHLVWDTCHGVAPIALVISNDSDLQVPLEMAMELGVTVIVVNPHRHSSQSNHLHGSDRRNLRVSHLRHAQFPDQVDLGGGRSVSKPAEWG